MIRATILCLVLSSCVAIAVSLAIPELNPPENQVVGVIRHLQDISVAVRTTETCGTGIYKVTEDGSVWVLTCAHIMGDLRHENDGKVEFDDAKVSQSPDDEHDAEVIRYTNFKYGDLALLRLRNKSFEPTAAVKFADQPPPVGSSLVHCGYFHADQGVPSFSLGIMSQLDKPIRGLAFDKTTCAAHSGHSGGGVLLARDGRYVGMLVSGIQGFTFIIPTRRIRDWAEKNGVEFILDDTKPVPDEATLRSLPIEAAAPEAAKRPATPPLIVREPRFPVDGIHRIYYVPATQ